ncbi:hypothetical protein AB6A40_007075 [Gnathostoma spinigerum]|uniref:Transmembrane protein 144 n=1 Tax=Gnathostoma spinigerum TaxID=75299 RepID=A0ABD6ESD5_9BILA
MVLDGTAIGLGACAVSSIFFGSMFVPIKRFDMGDGLFVQWIMGVSIFVIGMATNAVEGFPSMQPLAMLGGMLWALGNVAAVPILSLIGMGMGILVWGTANCVVGWACGRYGLFGLKANIPANTTLNYIGLILVICGGVLFSHLRPSSTITSRFSSDSPVTHEHVNPSHSDVEEEIDETSNLLQLQAKISKRKRVLGIALSVVSGIFYGVNFVPVIYIQEHTDKVFMPLYVPV